MNSTSIGSRIGLAALLAAALCLAGLPSAAEAGENEYLAKPVNCATAEADIAALEGEKASVIQSMFLGLTFMIPIGMAVQMVTGYEHNLNVAGGGYNKAFDDKIAEIKYTCGLQ